MNRRFPDNSNFPLTSVLSRRAHAAAFISGSAENPSISGTVKFYQTNLGVIVLTQIKGLPFENSPCGGRVFGFHIHVGMMCSGNMEDPFADTMTHYDPYGCEHPHHAGDLPPLFGNRGLAVSLVLTDRFSVREIIGKTVVIHDSPDDFTTQPAGNSGKKIACGEIKSTMR